MIDWAKDPQRRKCPGLGLFTSKRMEDVVFDDLKIKLGYPYLYCHQGNCEHLLIFTDLRLDYEHFPLFLLGIVKRVKHARTRENCPPRGHATRGSIK